MKIILNNCRTSGLYLWICGIIVVGMGGVLVIGLYSMCQHAGLTGTNAPNPPPVYTKTNQPRRLLLATSSAPVFDFGFGTNEYVQVFAITNGVPLTNYQGTPYAFYLRTRLQSTYSLSGTDWSDECSLDMWMTFDRYLYIACYDTKGQLVYAGGSHGGFGEAYGRVALVVTNSFLDEFIAPQPGVPSKFFRLTP